MILQQFLSKIFCRVIRPYWKYYAIVLLVIIVGFALYSPIKNGINTILSKKELRRVLNERDVLIRESRKIMDSVAYYKELSNRYKENTDSSNTVIIQIKQETNENITNIRNADVMYNIGKFADDMEQYIRSKSK